MQKLKLAVILMGIIIIALIAVLILMPSKKQAEPRNSFGFLKSIEKKGNEYVFKVDEAEMLSGDVAKEKAASDTGCVLKDVENCVPSLNNDFYIRNISTATVPLVLNRDAKIEVLKEGTSPISESVSFDDFINVYNKNVFIKNGPYNMVIKGDVITALSEQYTP